METTAVYALLIDVFYHFTRFTRAPRYRRTCFNSAPQRQAINLAASLLVSLMYCSARCSELFFPGRLSCPSPTAAAVANSSGLARRRPVLIALHDVMYINVTRC